MAIKGKGKTRGRQPARAPRREAVPVKPPFFLRRSVQVSVAFMAGVLLVLLLVWVTNGVRRQSAEHTAAAEASQQRTAAQAWKSEVEGALGKVGTLSPSAPPALFPTVGSAIAALQAGEAPQGVASALKQAQSDAKLAFDPLRSYDLVSQIRDKGMSKGQASWFLNSQTRIVQALQLYQQAAATAALAAVAAGDQRKAIADRAAAVASTAAEILRYGWDDYQNALASVQIVQAPTPTGLTGPTG